MALLTTNYNVIQCEAADKDKYKQGDTFRVPDHQRGNWRFMKFDGLQIEDISFGFGLFLYFDWNKWRNNNAEPEIDTAPHTCPVIL
jgi:hypothetical protein